MPASPHAHDRVAMPSRRADGTLDQTDAELIGPVDDAVAGVAHQLQTQAVAAVDDADADSVKTAVDQAKAAAKAEVSQLHPEA